MLPAIEFIAGPDLVTVLNNEVGFGPCDMSALCDIGASSKVARQVAGEATIGEKGLGFKSVFGLTDAPRLFSNGFRVEFDAAHPSGLGCVLPTQLSPEAVPSHALQWATCFELPFKARPAYPREPKNLSRPAL